MYTYIDYSDSYAPSAQTLFVKFKEIIELQFPNLPQNIIDNAINLSCSRFLYISIRDITTSKK